MRPIYILVLIVLWLPVLLFAQDILPSSEQVSAYRDSIDLYTDLVNQAAYSDVTSRGPALLDYLRTCRSVADAFEKLVREGKLEDLEHSFLQQRIDKRNDLLLLFRKLAEYPFERQLLFREGEVYKKQLSVIPAQRLTTLLKKRLILSDRKYFELDDRTKGSPLEIFFNGLFSFTSTELHNLSGPYAGIKPWEVNARFEPIGFIKEKNMTGILFSLGTIYNFFPEVVMDSQSPLVNETFASSKLKRMGLKLGAGGRMRDAFGWMAGGGLQVRAITVWGLYSFDREQFEVAFGLADISWLKYVLPYVE